MVSSWVYLFLMCSLCSGVFSAPLEKDPELTDGYFEGDIILDMARNGLSVGERLWPKGIVPYKISKDFEAALAANIVEAMREIEQCSCVRFVPAVNQTAYLQVIVSSAGCNAQLGYMKNIRTMKLVPGQPGRGCFKKGTIIHEFLHVLGFVHMQNCPDRDQYVKIVTKNIMKGKEHNFKKESAAEFKNYGQKYDYGSIMHYKATGFSVNGKPTIKALNPDGQALMGQRVKMSDVDIKKLNKMYKCPSKM